MIRKLVTAGVSLTAALIGLAGVPGVASAAAAPLVLGLSQGAAFATLGASCGGIQETVYANGFDPTSGYPTGVVDLKTTPVGAVGAAATTRPPTRPRRT